MTEPTTANLSDSVELNSTSSWDVDTLIDSEISMQISPADVAVTNIQYPTLVLSGDGSDLFVIDG